MSSSLVIILVVGALVAGGAYAFINRCKPPFYEWGFCGAEDTLQALKDNPDKYQDLDPGSGVISTAPTATFCKDHPGDGRCLTKGAKSGNLLIGTTQQKIQACTKPGMSGRADCKKLFAQARYNCGVNQNWLGGGFCKGLCKGTCSKVPKPANYARANLATESLMRMSY